mmetsp:Transcript_106280/g.307794  ORF Transcript_106280/g.307794 Transcript_106280/m.307794 type:complete len:336 (+) Transcript_106280:4013-5020(+)
MVARRGRQRPRGLRQARRVAAEVGEDGDRGPGLHRARGAVRAHELAPHAPQGHAPRAWAAQNGVGYDLPRAVPLQLVEEYSLGGHRHRGAARRDQNAPDPDQEATTPGARLGRVPELGGRGAQHGHRTAVGARAALACHARPSLEGPHHGDSEEFREGTVVRARGPACAGASPLRRGCDGDSGDREQGAQGRVEAQGDRGLLVCHVPRVRPPPRHGGLRAGGVGRAVGDARGPPDAAAVNGWHGAVRRLLPLARQYVAAHPGQRRDGPQTAPRRTKVVELARGHLPRVGRHSRPATRRHKALRGRRYGVQGAHARCPSAAGRDRVLQHGGAGAGA